MITPVMTLGRVMLGLFFVISGYHKLVNPSRHATLRQTLVDCGVPRVDIMCWFVPGVEFLGGLGVMFGFLTELSALGLMAICFVATVTNGMVRVSDEHPIDPADEVDDILYLPEVLYMVGLLIVLVIGGGPWSMDQILFNFR